MVKKEDNISLIEIMNKLNYLMEMMEHNAPKIYNNNRLSEYLGVSKSLLKQYREDGLIEFSQVGNQFFYTQEAVDNFLTNTRKYVYNN